MSCYSRGKTPPPEKPKEDDKKKEEANDHLSKYPPETRAQLQTIDLILSVLEAHKKQCILSVTNSTGQISK